MSRILDAAQPRALLLPIAGDAGGDGDDGGRRQTANEIQERSVVRSLRVQSSKINNLGARSVELGEPASRRSAMPLSAILVSSHARRAAEGKAPAQRPLRQTEKRINNDSIALCDQICIILTTTAQDIASLIECLRPRLIDSRLHCRSVISR